MTLTGLLAAAQEHDIDGVRWDLERVNDRILLNSPAFIEIAAPDGRFTGNSGCNRIFGPVRINARRITFSNVGITRRMCKLGPGSVPENDIVRALESTVRYKISGRLLTFYDRRGKSVLRFRREAVRPERVGLTDRKWLLETIGSHPVGVKDAFVTFDEQERTAGGNSGCNVYGGTYSERNGSISITEIMSTMRACEEGDRMEVERGLLNGLRNADRYEIKAERLYLYRGQDLLLTFRGEQK